MAASPQRSVSSSLPRAPSRARRVAAFAAFRPDWNEVDTPSVPLSRVRPVANLANFRRLPMHRLCRKRSAGGVTMTLKMRWVAAGAAALMAAAQAAAQTVDVHAGRLVDPQRATVLADQRIRIVDGRIASVGPWRAADGPAAVDWSAYTVLPGLIDLH